jgi:acyl carrier protein
MERSEALAKVVEVVVEQLGCEAKGVVETAAYVEDLGADSLDLVELVMAFEEEFDVSIPEEAVESIKTVGETADFIVAHL